MGLEQVYDISVSAIEAERTNMELIASNIANINTTRSLSGGPYRRKIAIFEEIPLTFDQALVDAEKKENSKMGGVKVKQIVEDQTPFQTVYNPSHPDADKNGFVQMPNVKLSKEMTDMVETSKMYEANIAIANTTKKMVMDTLQIQ